MQLALQELSSHFNANGEFGNSFLFRYLKLT